MVGGVGGPCELRGETPELQGDMQTSRLVGRLKHKGQFLQSVTISNNYRVILSFFLEPTVSSSVNGINRSACDLIKIIKLDHFIIKALNFKQQKY